MFKKLNEEIQRLRIENRNLEARNNDLSESIECYLERLNTYEKIWKDYNLSRYYSMENKVIGTISIVTENIKETFDFVSYNYDNDFLIVHLLNGIKYYPKNSIIRIEVYCVKAGDK